MSNYFIFIDAANDAACYPVERLVSMTCTSDSTLELSFERGLKGLGGEHDVVTLTFTQPAATATITITDYTELNAGDKVNLVATDGTNYDFVQGDQSSVNGTFEATTSNDQTATNLMNVINTSSGPSGTRFTATVAGAVVTVTQATGGVAGNTTVTLTDTGTAGMSKTNFSDTTLINSLLPSNLPPIGVLKADKKRIYSGIDNDAILSTYAYPLLYAYSTSTASTKPNVVFTLQDSKGATKKHTLVGTRIFNFGTWSSETTTGNTYLNAIPTGNYEEAPSLEQWRLKAWEEIADDTGQPANMYWHDGSLSGTGTDRYIDFMYNGSTDAHGNSKLRMYFVPEDDWDGNAEPPNLIVTTDLGEKLPDGNDGPAGYSTCLIVPALNGAGVVESDAILNQILQFILANVDAPEMELPLSIEGGSYTADGDDHYIDIIHGFAANTVGCTDDWVIGAGLQQTAQSNPMFTYYKQNDGCPVTIKTESAKKLLRVELDNAKELADTDRVYIKVFDALTTIMGDALVTDNTVAVLSNGSPIVDLSDDGISLFLDGTESRTRASNRDISSYNFDYDKLYKAGVVQASDATGVSDLMSGTFSTTGSKKLSYSFSNIGDTLDSDGRFYSTYRLPRLQVKDDMSDLTTAHAKDTLTYSGIEHFNSSTYTAAAVYMPTNLESRGLLMYSNHDTANTANWHNVSTRNLNDTQEIMGSANTGAEGTYVLNDSTNITDHPKSHLLMVRSDKCDRVYFRMNNNNAVGGAMPDVAITAYYANGTTWAPLEIIDETQGLKTSGSIKFTTPHDWYKGLYGDIDVDSAGHPEMIGLGQFPLKILV